VRERTWIPVVANGAFRSDDSLSGSALVAAADAFFSGLQRGFTVKVRDSGEDDDLRIACLEAGLEAFGDPVPEMICRTPLPGAPAVDGVAVRMIDDDAGVRDFISVNAEAYATYGMPPECCTTSSTSWARCWRTRRLPWWWPVAMTNPLRQR